MNIKACVLSFGLLCVATRCTLGDGVVRDSVGATAAGRGGTNIAFSDNGAVLLDNPAAIVNVPGNGMIGFGVDGLITDLDYSDPFNHVSNATEVYPLPYGSFIHKDPGGQWAVGLGFFIPAGFGGKWQQNAPPPIGGTREYDSLGLLAKLLPTAAFQVTDRLSIGGSVGVAFSQAELEGPFFLQTGLLRGTPTLLNLEADGVAPTWSLGLQYQLTDRTTVGLAYTSETRFQLNGQADATVFGLNPAAPQFGVPSRFNVDADLVWPRSLGFGIKHELTPRQRLALDVIWYDWSHAFSQLDLTLSNPSNPMFRPLGRVNDTFPLGWKDSVSVRLGHEYLLSPRDVLRTGYIYNSQTVPTSTLTSFIPATLEHTFSVGYGRTFGSWRFDTAYQFAFGPQQDVGDSAVVGGDFDRSSVTSRAHWFYFGLTKTFGPGAAPSDASTPSGCADR
jgi:long-subunit fatty acid transport protein